jgi:hypothetical protein
MSLSMSLHRINITPNQFSKLHYNVRRALMKDVRAKSKDFLKLTKKLTPVDKSDYADDVVLKDEWTLQEKIGVKSNVAFAIRLYNPLIYAEPIEFGSTPGQSPWPSVKKNKNSFKKPRTVLKMGKIWSSQAPGGVLDTVIIKSKFVVNDRAINKAIRDALGGK